MWTCPSPEKAPVANPPGFFFVTAAGRLSYVSADFTLAGKPERLACAWWELENREILMRKFLRHVTPRLALQNEKDVARADTVVPR